MIGMRRVRRRMIRMRLTKINEAESLFQRHGDAQNDDALLYSLRLSVLDRS